MGPCCCWFSLRLASFIYFAPALNKFWLLLNDSRNLRRFFFVVSSVPAPYRQVFYRVLYAAASTDCSTHTFICPVPEIMCFDFFLHTYIQTFFNSLETRFNMFPLEVEAYEVIFCGSRLRRAYYQLSARFR